MQSPAVGDKNYREYLIDRELTAECIDPVLLINADDIRMELTPTFNGAYHCIMSAIYPYVLNHVKTLSHTYRIIEEPTLILAHSNVPNIDGKRIFIPREFIIEIKTLNYSDDGYRVRYTIDIRLKILDGNDMELIPANEYTPFKDYDELLNEMNIWKR